MTTPSVQPIPPWKGLRRSHMTSRPTADIANIQVDRILEELRRIAASERLITMNVADRVQQPMGARITAVRAMSPSPRMMFDCHRSRCIKRVRALTMRCVTQVSAHSPTVIALAVRAASWSGRCAARGGQGRCRRPDRHAAPCISPLRVRESSTVHLGIGRIRCSSCCSCRPRAPPPGRNAALSKPAGGTTTKLAVSSDHWVIRSPGRVHTATTRR